ncbi:hypothetical protein SAMN05216516_101515 [Izhakiella capsodis]|uniref:Uncharacterized protein n=1 Tax=Izhakiella capsodis TaxID=1367852 RepID=A0A1I4V2W9_9GAMM|nr:hypothetical protein SAMN05216516_101515 [Izhakiella capsodis]
MCLEWLAWVDIEHTRQNIRRVQLTDLSLRLFLNSKVIIR